jgi:hypothetical protein
MLMLFRSRTACTSLILMASLSSSSDSLSLLLLLLLLLLLYCFDAAFLWSRNRHLRFEPRRDGAKARHFRFEIGMSKSARSSKITAAVAYMQHFNCPSFCHSTGVISHLIISGVMMRGGWRFLMVGPRDENDTSTQKFNFFPPSYGKE